MNQKRDEVLQKVKEVDPLRVDVSGWVRTSDADALRRRVLSSDPDSGVDRRSPHGRPVLRLSIVLLMIAAGVAATRAIVSEPTSNVFTVGCYAELSQRADTVIVPIQEGLSPAETCMTHPEAFPQGAPNQLVSCVVSGGGTGVFPNPSGLSPVDACASIGAALPAHGRFYGGLTANEVRSLATDLGVQISSLDRSLDGGACYPAQGLLALLNTFLRDRDAVEWSVRDATTDAAPVTADGQRCADVVIDELGATLIVVDGDA
jgi:hypothetical protein